MTAQIINGKQIAAETRLKLKEKIAALPKKPTLAVILIGDDSASKIYVNSKEKACNEVGITAQSFHLPESTTQEELLTLINKLNQDKKINGILIQLPLPPHINKQEVLNAVSSLKDVDGFHPLNTGLLQQKCPLYIPCTPKGIIRLLHSVKQNLAGLNAVIIGRSQIVGIPTAQLLLQENCTVTVTHSYTKDLPLLCRSADILVSAIGKPEFITKEYIKPNSIIIDVGINRTQKGLVGDVKFSDAEQIASYITPVPGGVGPMTIAMLLENTYEAFLNQQNI